MWRGLALSKWALHDIREVCDNTKDMSLAELV
jgi:hypothetical protein